MRRTRVRRGREPRASARRARLGARSRHRRPDHRLLGSTPTTQIAARAAAAESLELAASAQWWQREFDAILRFLTAAVLLDDHSILADFTTWLHQRSRAEPDAYSDIGSLLATMSDQFAAQHPAESALLRTQINPTGDLAH